MKNEIFRKKSLEGISSPEELSDYLHVTSPSVWLILAAVVLLLVGMLLWASMVSVDSLATGTAEVDGGSMRIVFNDEKIAFNVQPGMMVKVGETESKVSSVGKDDAGNVFATASTALSDGSYEASVILRQTQVLRMLFN